ncbi:MAG TPA: NTP transferase domain-containing protein [Vicinamibacterales bacterium]|nr:NTP transferase domain-containing protein [Vicinamibacterales bacterium]
MRRINLIPMAGAGERFAEAAYALPKPLIPVAGVPMVVRAARALPPADQWIFVCRGEHVRDARIDRELRKHFSPATVLTVDQTTEGQASTCLLAAGELRSDDRLTIGACDNGMTYDAARLDDCWRRGADAVIWTFRGDPAVLRDPSMYGWVDVDENGRVRRVSCKVPLSDEPLTDHAVVGAFSFRAAGEFIRTAERTIALDRRVNGEFYLDLVLDQAAADGLHVRVLEVDRYICWGTPADLEAYARRDRP